jgi:DNA-binding NtrC family response regulator
MPALRERREDIPLLVEHFLQVNAYGSRPRLQMSKEAMDYLTAYSWPGNIRELRNCIERLSVLAEGPLLTVDSLPPSIVRAAETTGAPDVVGDVPLDEIERVHILRTLDRHRWNKKRVAAILGIDTKTLYNKLRRYGVPIGGRPEVEASASGRPSGRAD